MSEGADSGAQTCENSLTTLKDEGKPDELPPRTITYTGRRPRFGTGNVPMSPYILIDGRKLRSALALSKKWPPRRVSFPTNDTQLVTGYLEPANPWKHAENVNREDLISAYKESCLRHESDPLESVLAQLQSLDLSDDRCDELSLKGETLDQKRAEPLEEILKRVQFDKIDLEGTSLNDESSVIMFDMLEYYESAKQLNISCNQDIGVRGWQACAHMIKKTPCLEQLEAKDVMLNEQYVNILSRALRLVCHLHVLKLENCGLSGRSIGILVTALKMNTGIRELYLADNGLDLYDAIQLGSLLRMNNHVQLLDISNNNIQDDGVRDILEGLINQVNEDKTGRGLNVLILWNNRLTQKSSPHFSRIIALSKTLETLNVGQNMLTNEMLNVVKDALKKNRILLQLGMQSTEITCDGILTLTEIMETNQILQRIDLRDNSIQMTGMEALATAMKNNKSITQLDLDDKPRMKIDGTLHQYMDLLAEIRGYCTRNEKTRPSDESTEDSESPQHHSRLFSASSRKISLTCQTLPCSPPSMTPVSSEESGRSMLEPKRTSGGRLRSPAPSPIPSPVASPIPSPSRNRFVVSRVSETSLSTDSSASSSPVTPPSLGSSPKCFFPSASGSSRFRVSVVETASSVSSPKPVVATSKANVTIGFTFNVDTVESTDSDDSDNVFKSGPEASNSESIESTCVSSSSRSIAVTDEVTSESSQQASLDAANAGAKEVSTKECFISSKDTINVKSQDSISVTVAEQEENYDKRDNQCNRDSVLNPNCAESTKSTEIRVEPVITETDSIATAEDTVHVNRESELPKESDDAVNREESSSDNQLKKNVTVQKHTSSLEKLLALFQHPGSFFSDSSNVGQPESKFPLQDSVSSMMALGDKFQQYLRDGRGSSKPNTAGSSCTSTSNLSSSPTKAKTMRSLNVTQLSSIQTLTNMFASFKLDTSTNQTVGTCTKSSKPTENIEDDSDDRTNEGKNLTDVQAVSSTESCGRESDTLTMPTRNEEMNVSSSNNQSLPDIVQSKDNDGHTSNDLVLDTNTVNLSTIVNTCSKTVNSTASANIAESKMTVCVPKLKDIPEYSILDISDGNVENENVGEELAKSIDSIRVDKICDRSSTDSINLTSDSNSSSCNIICDIKAMGNVNTVDVVSNSIRESHSDMRDEDAVTCITQGKNKEVPYVCTTKYNCRVNNDTDISHNASKDTDDEKCLNDDVTNTCRIDNNNHKESFTYPRNILCQTAEDVNTCHADDLTLSKSTTVNSKIEVSTSDVRFTSKNITGDSRRGQVDLTKVTEVGGPSDDFGLSSPGRIEPRTTDVSSGALEADQLPIPNNVSAHRATFTAETTKLKATSDGIGRDHPLTKSDLEERAFIPLIILPGQSETYHDLEASHPLRRDRADKSETEDLIFCITDISPNGNAIDADLFSPSTVSGDGVGGGGGSGESGESGEGSCWPTDAPKTTSSSSSSFYDLSQASHSPTNLLIKSSEAPHRNSQDSGIEEANMSASDDNPSDPAAHHQHPRESFQESVDSGIESECSSVSVKADSGIDEAASGVALAMQKSLREVRVRGTCGRIDDFHEFEADILEDVERTGADPLNEVAHSYLEMVKCGVVTSAACSVTNMSITDTVSIGVAPQESIVITEPSTVVQATSSK